MKNKIIAFVAAVASLLSLTGCDCSCHDHDYSISNYDEYAHWQECSLCGKKANVTPHNFAYAGNNTEHWKVCECGYEGPKEEHHLVHQHNDTDHYDICQDCLHKFDIKPHEYAHYDYDSNNHWLECDCGQEEATKEPHSFTQKVVDAKYLKEEATTSHPGVYYYSCICGAKGSETFESGLPLNHTHTYDYKGICTSEWCDNSIQRELEYEDVGYFDTIGEMVFKMYLPLVGKVSLIANFAVLNEPVVIYKENGDQLIKYYASGEFTNDKAQTVYVHVKPTATEGYIVFTCSHQINYTGHCTQCDYDTCNHLKLNEEKVVEIMNLQSTYFSFTAPYSGLFEVIGDSVIDDGVARFEDFKNSDGTSADHTFGHLVAQKDETYYFRAFADGSQQREKYKFVVREVRDEVTAIINSVAVTMDGETPVADLSITILEGSITRGQIINIISNSGKFASYIVDDVETDTFAINFEVISAATVNNHIFIRNTSLSTSDKYSLITDKDQNVCIDTLYFNYRMFSVEEIGEDIPLSNGARVMLDVFNDQTFVPAGAMTILHSPTVEDTLCPSEGAGIEIKFAFPIPSNLFKNETIYNVLLRFNGLYTVGECALVKSKEVAESIRYHDEIKYYSEKAKNGHLDILDRYWAADLGKGTMYYSTLTLTDAGKFYESDYQHFKLFLEIVDTEDTPNGLKVTYTIIYDGITKEGINIKELDYLYLIDDEGGRNTANVHSAGDNYFIFKDLSTTEPIMSVAVGFAW